ncbi:MAG: phosphopantetheine-binding protein [Proteobacteria bacterium]|nr:phosphopantetheine-binding protein [Pseudomonadota bacterium]MCZ6895271.1 phosphopantetheine-binding protein [Gammaproteobacteria bacterium]
MNPDSENAVTARRLLANALQMNVDELESDAAIGRTERWDSLAHMNLILALEQYLGQPLDTDTMLAIESLADIIALLRSSE